MSLTFHSEVDLGFDDDIPVIVEAEEDYLLEERQQVVNILSVMREDNGEDVFGQLTGTQLGQLAEEAFS